MLVDDIADRIAIACPVEIDGIVRDMWVDHTHGRLTDNEAEVLDEAARARREAIHTRRTETRPKPRTAPSSAPRASARRPQRSPDRQASIERRRRLGGSSCFWVAISVRLRITRLQSASRLRTPIRVNDSHANAAA